MLAFKDLNADRPLGGDTIYRITLRQIVEWAQIKGFGFDSELIEELTTHIRELDEKWVSLEIERRKKAAKKKTGKSNGEKVGAPKLRTTSKSVRERLTETAE